MVTTDDGSDQPYKVTFADGQVSGWLREGQVKSSGMMLDHAGFISHIMATRSAEVREACSRMLPDATREALAEVRRRVARDELPLLSLLQTEPLQLQASHLSFQEYFAARSLCEGEGALLQGDHPWQWPAWWANVVAMGDDMDGFCEGLMRAAQIESSVLDLSEKLGGHRPTVVRVVKVLCKALTSIDLTSNGLDAEAAKVLMQVISGSTSVTVLDMRYNQLDTESATKLANIAKEKAVSLCGIKAGQTEADFRSSVTGFHMRPADAILLTADLAVRTSLTSINLAENNLANRNDMSGIKLLSSAIADSPSLTVLNAEWNNLGDEGKVVLQEAVKGCAGRLRLEV